MSSMQMNFDFLGYIGKFVPQENRLLVKIGTPDSYQEGDKWVNVTRWNTVTILGDKFIEYVKRTANVGDFVRVQGYTYEGQWQKNGETVYGQQTRAVIFDVKVPKSRMKESSRDNHSNGEG